MVEIRTTLSSKSSPATERVIIVTFWQIRMLQREPKSVMKPKIRSSPAKTTQPFNRSASAGKDQDWWDRHHEPGWLEAHNGWHTTWDLIRKFGQWFSLPPRLWSCSWRWQPPALEASSASAPAAKQPARENADDSTKPSPNNDISSMKQPDEGHKR